MKVNEAPEKIYIQPNAHDGWFEAKPYSDNFVEYIRTDTFIDTVCAWLKNFNDFHNIMRYSDCCEVPIEQIIEDFRDYIKE